MQFSFEPPALLYALVLCLPLGFFYHRHFYSRAVPKFVIRDLKPLKTVMQPPRDDLAPPKDDPFTLKELTQYDGSDASRPIYVAIKGVLNSLPANPLFHLFISKGTVFDVSHKMDVYGPGKSYSIFAGKDGSKGLGMSSLKPEDAVPDYSGLPEAEMKTLNDWHSFFS